VQRRLPSSSLLAPGTLPAPGSLPTPSRLPLSSWHPPGSLPAPWQAEGGRRHQEEQKGLQICLLCSPAPLAKRSTRDLYFKQI